MERSFTSPIAVTEAVQSPNSCFWQTPATNGTVNGLTEPIDGGGKHRTDVGPEVLAHSLHQVAHDLQPDGGHLKHRQHLESNQHTSKHSTVTENLIPKP